ncbi:eukaryotic cytochrome b561-domain-containing protein [Lipomyces japonicus]|uniref:eukaryotic cytochrome b561-domain-containing protein n=1 Tax=Lipomyces japonicus TaxID=56871 RepID=UPI0034CE996D
MASNTENNPLLYSRSSVDTETDEHGRSNNSSDSGRHLYQTLKKNLYNSNTSIVAQVGVITFFLYVIYKIIRSPIIYFTGHPVLNSFALLLMAQSIILVQPTKTQAEKQLAASIHGVFNMIAFGAFVGAFAIIYTNKAGHDGAHFASAHARLGGLTYVVLTVNVVVGFSQFWTPQIYGSIDSAKSLYKYHRVVGYFVILSGVTTVLLASRTNYSKNVLHLSTVVLLGLVVVIVVGLGLRIRPEKFNFQRVPLS